MDEKRDAPSSPSNPSPPSSSGAGAGAGAAAPDGLARLRSADTVADDEGPGRAVVPGEQVEGKSWWKFKMRKDDDDGETDWWFASTAIPLLAATLGPLANVLSLAALVTSWRMYLYDEDGNALPELQGRSYHDPKWCYWINVASLVNGFVGNIFLLFNFTNRIRYIVALPMTILNWYIATGMLIAITVSINQYVPPQENEAYTQGFWYAIEAAVLYLICSMLLMVNMLGYFLGHYPQHFTLTDHQRTLILQTMLFFIWLAGGAAVFSRVESLHGTTDDAYKIRSFADGLYFCDVTILTVGFGDLYPHDDIGRGLVFPYSVGGIIMLGLVISSIHNFAAELGENKLVKGHLERHRTRTISRTVTNGVELQRRITELPPGQAVTISAPFDPVKRSRTVTFDDFRRPSVIEGLSLRRPSLLSNISLPPPTRQGTLRAATKRARKPKILLLREEKDRFEAMRKIQESTTAFKRWWALTLSVIAFGVLWCVGAAVFWRAEQKSQGMTYFEALYFCYVSLLTIGYGDLSPKSNAGRCFFVVWSLIAVPTMTLLISDMGDTVIRSFKHGTFRIADFTVLPKHGIWRAFLERHPWLLDWLQARAARKRVARGFPIGPAADSDGGGADATPPPDIATLAAEAEAEASAPPDEAELARRLALAIRAAAHDLRAHGDRPRRYSYEEWVEFTRLIRFTAAGSAAEVEAEEAEEGLIEWDWIGEDSPMMAGVSEPEFVLDRLCESLARYIRRNASRVVGVGQGGRGGGRGVVGGRVEM